MSSVQKDSVLKEAACEDLELGVVVEREESNLAPGDSQRRADAEEAGGGKLFKRTRQIVKPPSRVRVALRKLDNYAVDVSPPKFAGGIITIVIWLATIAYIIWTLYQWFTRPVEISNTIEWMSGGGPFPMTMICRSKTGCYMSNVYKNDPATTGGLTANPEQERCIFFEYGKNVTADILFSMDPNDGATVLFDNTQTDVPDFGILVSSTVVCGSFRPQDPCLDGIKFRNAPASKGIVLSNLVVTENLTVSDAGRHRREWFGLALNQEAATPDAAFSACVDTVANLSDAGNFVQTRIVPNVNFVTSTVTRANNWTDLFGIIGGGYELFIAVGALILVTSFSEGGFNIMTVFAATG